MHVLRNDVYVNRVFSCVIFIRADNVVRRRGFAPPCPEDTFVLL